MAVAQNNSEEAVVGTGGKLYTGIAEMSVLAVNPTMEELHALGIMVQKEPEYTATIKDEVLTKIVFWLGNADAKVKCEILVNKGPWVSTKTGKVKMYNRIGQDTWAKINPDGTVDQSEMNDFLKERDTFYSIPRGMDTVTEFVRAWANVAQDGEIKLDTVDAISNGNVAELRQLVKALSKNLVRVLVWVKDEKYMGVYNRHFGRVNPKRNDLFVKAMNEAFGAILGDYSIEWKEYVPGELAPTADPVATDAPVVFEDLDDDIDPFKVEG